MSSAALALSHGMKQLQRLDMRTWLPVLESGLDDLPKTLERTLEGNPFARVKTPRAGAGMVGGASSGASDKAASVISTPSLYEDLMAQIVPPLFPTPLSQNVAKAIIESLNEEGYYEGDSLEIARNLSTTREKVEAVRGRFAYLDPPGIGAISFKEAFMFQLAGMEIDEELFGVLRQMIVDFEHAQRFSRHARFAEAKALLRRLVAPPAMRYQEETPPIVPDLVVRLEHDHLVVLTNDAAYPEIIIDTPEGADRAIRTRLRSARTLSGLLGLRRQTLLQVGLFVLEHQEAFFWGGDLAPLQIQEAADHLGYNQSTVSRAVANKYIGCDRGVFALRHFFTHSLAAGISDEPIKRFLKERVAHESPSNPLTDEQLTLMVNQRFGLSLVRRSITKYRQQLNIGSVRERRRLHQLGESA